MNSKPSETTLPIAWWRVPQMWLVVGGPVVVVIAAIVTAIIAVKYQDPVLDKSDYEQALKAAHALQGEARDAAIFNALPANQGRNHATTLTAPPAR